MTTSVRPATTVRLRAKNQLTLPDVIARELEVSVGDRFAVRVEGPGRISLQRIPRSAAGTMPGMWGTQEEALAEIRAMRDSWREL